MKRIFSLILLFVSLLTLFMVSSKEIAADNGVPYETYTFSTSQQSLVRTQDAYVPLSLTRAIGNHTLNKPMDITADANDNIYIADSMNSVVIRFSLADAAAEPLLIGEGILKEPTGVAIDQKGNLYVADIGNEKAYKFIYNEGDFQLDTVYERPESSPLFLEDEPFKPSKVIVDHGENVYLVLSGNINGLAQYNNSGEFFGYFGGNQLPATFQNIIRKLLFNEEQRRTWFKMIPVPVYNISIDKKGSILTATKTLFGYKKLNIGNTVISESPFGTDTTEDIAVGPINNIFTISEEGIILEYSEDGSVLFIFGGHDTLLQKGLFKKASGITVDSRGNLFAIDSEANAMQVFYPTQFAVSVHSALDYYQNGLYKESRDLWNEVLKMNSLFDLAHRGLGSSYFASGEYEESMIEFRLARDQQGYSDAYWEVRNIYLLNNAQYYIIVLFALLILYLINLKWKFLKYITVPFKMIDKKLKKYKLYTEIMYVFTVLRHPIDGFYGIKKQNKTSVLSATILLIIFYIIYIVSLYQTGFLFNDTLISEINVFQETITVLVPFFLWVIANYLVCSIREGEGKFRHVYQASVYMLIPAFIAIPILTLLSNYLTYNESFIYEFGYFTAIFIAVIYAVLMVKEIHNYGFSSSVGNILLSVFTAFMMAVVAFILYILMNEIIGLLTDIWIEVMSRG